MIVTKIEKQKKARNRYNIFLDGSFEFGLYDDTILKFGLLVNDDLSEKLTAEIREYDEIIFAKNVAYSFLSYRQRSKKEISQKLKSKNISENVIAKTIATLTEQKYVDDYVYSKLFLESTLRGKPIGKRLLTYKLQGKGIDKEIIERIVSEEYSDETESDSARKLLEKYSVKLKGTDEYGKRKKCFSYLVSRGFDFDVSNKIINEFFK